ncbi:unnamed protein product [Gongylonema pulchrum]|uniref:Telomerase reverse transcriptase n=1 Tax=Gongylonema pulchrum TaxID=637853 RepID=A0A183F0D5_9BILA|nr:unnamed protein product [Gongylonema pulchrum]
MLVLWTAREVRRRVWDGVVGDPLVSHRLREQGVRTRANKKERRGPSVETDKKAMSSPLDGEMKQQRNGKRKRNHAQNSDYGNAKRRSVKEERDDSTDVQDDEQQPGSSSSSTEVPHLADNFTSTAKVADLKCFERY